MVPAESRRVLRKILEHVNRLLEPLSGLYIEPLYLVAVEQHPRLAVHLHMQGLNAASARVPLGSSRLRNTPRLELLRFAVQSPDCALGAEVDPRVVLIVDGQFTNTEGLSTGFNGRKLVLDHLRGFRIQTP